jgi:pyruvate kinase
VHVMSHVAEVTEQYLQGSPDTREGQLKLKTMHFSAAVANGVRRLAEDLKVRLVVVYSQTGATARIFSKSRLPAPIVALSNDHSALRRMALHYGVIPQEMPSPRDIGELVGNTDRIVRERKLATPGQPIIIVAGASLGTPGTMNGILLHTVGERYDTEVE